MQRNRGKQQNGKKQIFLQGNYKCQGNISCKDGHNKGQKQQTRESIPLKLKIIKQSREIFKHIALKFFKEWIRYGKTGHHTKNNNIIKEPTRNFIY